MSGTPPGGGAVAEIVAALIRDHQRFARKDRPVCEHSLPSRASARELIDLLRTVFFPGYYGQSELTSDSIAFHVGAALDRARRLLHEQVRRCLCFACRFSSPCADCEGRADQIVASFVARMPAVGALLDADVQAGYLGDPAATSADEVIFCYPGLQALINHRVAHELQRLAVPLLPRIMGELAHSQTGIDIHPGATIGPSFFIDHGTGVVVGETTEIGARVRLYQGVTLGAKSFPLDAQGNPIKGVKRHPTIGDDVIIYAGATLLGPITVGAGAVIGGNVWVTEDVPPGVRITQAIPQALAFDGGAGI